MKPLLSCLICVALANSVCAEDQFIPPNILFIVADDLGWHDLACQGNPLVETPVIDQLARDGMRFTDAYAAAPVCSPTRAALITGRTPARLHITNHLPDRDSFTPDNALLLPAPMSDHLPLEEVTFSEQLKQAGYTTAFFGKWHLAARGDEAFYPTHQGFDLNIGGCDFGGPPSYFDPYKNPTIENRKAGEYLPDRLADETIAFIKANKERQFLACLWNYTVHWPMEAPEALLKKYEDRKGPGLNDTRYGAMIEALDRSVGKILAALDELKLRENTLVIFTSDNGGFGGVSDNRPLRAAKGHLYEGGIRVPLIVRWPKVVPAGTTCETPVISMDFAPTFREAAGVEAIPALICDGVSLIPLLRQKPGWQRETLYFHFPNYAWHRSNRLGSAIRWKNYKLIERFDDGQLELFDLQADLSETKDLASEQPELAARLRQQLSDWRKEVGANMPLHRDQTPVSP